MSDKWRLLALLFLARCVMGAQFESVGALGPLLKAEGIDYRQLGILIGAYLAPGLLVALPGGVLVQRLGDRTTILLCLLMMALGSLLEVKPEWSAMLAARVLAGTGGVVLTVAATKMIVDRFSGKELAGAMAIFVNSWPCGIALALVCLPAIGQTFGLPSTSVFVVLFALAVFGAMVLMMPKPTTSPVPLSAATPNAASVFAVCVVGTIWGIANAAFATVFGFGPALLSEKGYPASTAASLVSIVLWVTILAIPIGGAIAARLTKTNALIVGCLLVAVALLAAMTRIGNYVPLFFAIGIVSGLPGAAIMGLLPRVLNANSRAIGMGIFYSIYYAIMLVFPILQGAIARTHQSAAVTFNAAALSLLICIPLLAAFGMLARRSSPSLVAAQSAI